MLISLSITRKCVVLTGLQVNCTRSKNLRKNYALNFLDTYHNDKINIFIDESGFNLHLRRKHGRSPRGQVVQSIVPASRGTNVSLISAISNEEVIHAKCLTGSVKATDFKTYMTELISICRQKFPQGIFKLFVDSARIHHANIIIDFLNKENINMYFYRHKATCSIQLNTVSQKSNLLLEEN